MKKALTIVVLVLVAYAGFRWGPAFFPQVERALGIEGRQPPASEVGPSPELADAYRRRLADETLVEQFSRIDLVQIYQATLAFDASSPYGMMISGKLQRDAQRVWEQTSQGRVTISKLHRDVSETLTRMGVPHEIERLAADNCFSVDIALRGRKVAIEVDGPSHFFANRQSEYMGADKLREKVLEAKGWTVRTPCDFLRRLVFFVTVFFF